MNEKIAKDEFYLEVQDARAQLENILSKQVASIHDIVDRMDMQSGEKEFLFSKIRLAPRKIRNQDMIGSSKRIENSVEGIKSKRYYSYQRGTRW